MTKKIFLFLLCLLAVIPVSFAQGKPNNFNLIQFVSSPNRWKYTPQPFLGFIDVRASAMLTGTVDTWQTSRFKKLGLVERWNPAAEAALNAGGNWLYVPTAMLTIAVLDTVIQKSSPRDRTWMYVAWWGIEIAATLNNRRWKTGGIPILFPVIKTTFSTGKTELNAKFNLSD